MKNLHKVKKDAWKEIRRHVLKLITEIMKYNSIHIYLSEIVQLVTKPIRSVTTFSCRILYVNVYLETKIVP